MTIKIDDPDDPRIADFRDIRERDLVGRQGKFIAEGRVVLNVLVNEAPQDILSFLILENRLEGVADLLAKVPIGVPIYVVSANVIDKIAGFHLHRGLLAVARCKPEVDIKSFVSALPANALLLILAGISNHDNMGAIFRNAAAFEANGVLMDAASCDPLYRKAIRVSVGACLQVPFTKASTILEICDLLAVFGYQLGALSPQGQEAINQFPKYGRRALILGTEGQGLSKEILQSVRSFKIPMSNKFDSLNVATAAGIALFHASSFSIPT